MARTHFRHQKDAKSGVSKKKRTKAALGGQNLSATQPWCGLERSLHWLLRCVCETDCVFGAQVNAPKTTRTFCKAPKCRKHQVFKVTQSCAHVGSTDCQSACVQAASHGPR